MSAPHDSTLADPEQLIADLRCQLAEREAELAEALGRQTAMQELLQVINASTGDLVPVFEYILDSAHKICGAAVGSVQTFDGTCFCAVATHGYPPAHDAMMRRPHLPGRIGQALIDGEIFLHIPDLDAAPVHDGDGRWRSLIEMIRPRTALHVPLRKDDTLLGMISAFRTEMPHSPIKRSGNCRHLPPRPCWQWRTPASWENCANAPAKSRT